MDQKVDAPVNSTGKGAAILVKEFFGCENSEIMQLPKADRIALGSAVAREKGLTQADLSFRLVEY